MATVDNLNLKISADSKKAVASLDELIDKVNRLNSALNSINTNGISQIGKASKRTNPGNGSSGTGANTLDKDKRKYDGFFKTITSGSDKAGLSFNRLGDKVFRLASTFGMFYAAAYPFIRLMKSFGTQTKNAMDYVETFNYYRVSMNKIARDSGEEAAEGFATSFEKRVNDLTQKMTGFKIGTNGELFDANDKSLGLDPNLLMNFQARIGAVTNSVGLLGDTSIATQKALSMLSADLSSLTNTDLESVMGNLQSGLIGQSRALYKYGLDITNATLQTYALENGVTKAVSSMTQAEKMQLRLLAILDQSKVAWGDQANTLGSVANQYRILQQQISNLGRVIGNLFLPIVQKVLPYINAMVIALRKLLTIFGFSLFGNNWLKDIMDGISSGSSGAVDGMEDFADAENEATKNAKKLQNATMGFDELNIISDNSSSGGKGSGGSDFDLGGAIQDALEDYEKVWDEAFKNAENKAEELANRIVSAFKRGGFEGLGRFISNGLSKQLESINWKNVYKGAENFGKGLADFLNGLITPRLFGNLGKTLAGALNIAILSYKAFWTHFDGKKLGSSIARGVNLFFREIKAKDLAEGLNAFVDTIEDAFFAAVKNIKWSRILKKLGEFIGNLDFDTVVVLVGLKLVKKLPSLLMKLKIGETILAFTKANIPKLLASIGSLITGAIASSNFASTIVVAIGALLPEILAGLAAFVPLIGGAIIGGIAIGEAIHVSDVELIEALGDDFEDLRYKIEDSQDGLESFGESLANVHKTYTDTIANATTEYENVDKLISQYDLLAQKENLSAKEKEQLNNITKELMSQIPEMSKYYDSESGYFTKSAEELRKLNEQKLEELKIEAKKQKFTDYYEQYSETLDNVKDAYSNYTEAVNQNNSAESELAEKLKNHQINRWEYKKAIEESRKSVDDAKTTLSTYSEQLDTVAGRVNGLSNDMYGISDAVEYSNSIVTESGVNVGKVLDEIKTANSEVSQSFDKSSDSMSKFKLSAEEITNSTKWQEVGNSIGTNVSAGIQEGMVANTKETSNSTSMSLLDMIKESLKIAFGIHSPATSMYDVGENIFLGVIEGMKNTVFDVEAIKTKISEGWNSVLEWWNNTAIVQWWDGFKQSFSVENISLNIGSFVEGFTPKWSEVESWWNDTVMPSVDGANESFGEKMDEISEKISGTLDTIKTDGKEKINALIGGFEGFLNKIISGINSFIGLLNGMIASAVANINMILAYLKLPPITVNAIATLKKVSIPRLAVGGQVDEGQLFIAREAGPELVGSMGGKTTVANNDQIVEGIQSGVRAAVAEVLAPYLREIANNTRETADKDFSFSITDRDIARANISGQRSLGMTLRTS